MAEKDEEVFEPDDTSGTEAASDAPVERAKGAHKILVIDDDDEVRRSIVRCLHSMSVEIFEASNGKEGIALLAKEPEIKMLITDIVMPELDGMKLISILRNTEAFADISIIVLTGHATPQKLQQAKALGVSDWISKPFDSDRIIHAVGKTLVALS